MRRRVILNERIYAVREVQHSIAFDLLSAVRLERESRRHGVQTQEQRGARRPRGNKRANYSNLAKKSKAAPRSAGVPASSLFQSVWLLT